MTEKAEKKAEERAKRAGEKSLKTAWTPSATKEKSSNASR